MMSDGYSLSIRRARIVRVAAALFVVIGMGSIIGTVAAMVRPGLSVHCGIAGCADRTALIDLAPEDARPTLAASRPAKAAFERHVTRPLVRAGLAGTQMLRDLPFAALMLAVGFALRKLAARKGNDLARAVPWLRGASVAALLMVVTTPIADSLKAMILYPGTPVGAMWYFELDLKRLTFDLVLALAAFSVVWALDVGSRAERDVAAFV